MRFGCITPHEPQHNFGINRPRLGRNGPVVIETASHWSTPPQIVSKPPDFGGIGSSSTEACPTLGDSTPSSVKATPWLLVELAQLRLNASRVCRTRRDAVETTPNLVEAMPGYGTPPHARGQLWLATPRDIPTSCDDDTNRDPYSEALAPTFESCGPRLARPSPPAAASRLFCVWT